MPRKRRKKSGIVERIFDAVVQPGDLAVALTIWAEMPEAERTDPDARLFALMPHFLGPPGQKGSPGLDLRASSKLSAVMFRMEALAGLSKMAQFRGWSFPGREPGSEMISAQLLEVAATEPLIEVNERPTFDADRFFKSLLRVSTTSGTA